MRFTEAVIVVLLVSILTLGFCDGIKDCMKLEKVTSSMEESYYSRKFISQSFINCCRNSGFVDLNEWQEKCRALFGLEYIAWSDAEEFMEVSMNYSSESLFYGTWIMDGDIYQVYCRKRRNVE